MTAVTKNIEWDFHLLSKVDTCGKFQLSRLLWDPARECDVHTYRQTDRQMYAQTPGENSANSGPAGLVPGPELSKIYFLFK